MVGHDLETPWSSRCKDLEFLTHGSASPTTEVPDQSSGEGGSCDVA